MAAVGVLCAVLPDHLAFNTADCISGWLLYAVIHTPCVLLTQVTHRGKHGCELGGEKSWRDGALGERDLSSPHLHFLSMLLWQPESWKPEDPNWHSSDIYHLCFAMGHSTCGLTQEAKGAVVRHHPLCSLTQHTHSESSSVLSLSLWMRCEFLKASKVILWFDLVSLNPSS